MTRIISLIFIVCFFTISVFSQKTYTLEECKKMALQNNAASLNSQLSIKAAQETKKSAFTNYFPSISATGIGFATNDPLYEMATENGTVGMFKKGMLGSVMASMPLFAGGQIITGNKLAKAGVEASNLQKIISDDEIELNVSQYFWQIVSLKEKMKTINEAETFLNQVHKNVENAFKAGVVNKNDLLKVELKQYELDVNKLKATNGLSLLKMVLAQYIGVDYNDFETAQIADDALPSPSEVYVNHQEALLLRPEYQLLDKNIEVNKMQVKMKIGENLPTVAIGAGYSYVNIDRKTVTEMKKNIGMAFATVSIPITNWWGGSHDIRKQKINVMISENSKQDNKEKLLVQMQQLQNELDESWLQIELSRKSISSAVENVRLNEDYYKAGTGLLADLLDAQTALQQCRDQFTEATVNYRIKLIDYRRVTVQK